MEEQSHELAGPDEDFIPLEPVTPTQAKTCPVCFAKMVPDSPICHRCEYDERVGPESSNQYKRVTSENRYGEVSTDPGGSGDAPRTLEVRRRREVGRCHRCQQQAGNQRNR